MKSIRELKIPAKRVAVLIGKDGADKKDIENRTECSLNIGKEGDVTIEGESLNAFNAENIIRAIGRGFNPEIALLLLKQDYAFEMISLQEITKSKDSMLRLKGRVIGKEGRSRQLIEDLTESHISVYGKTISIIGSPESSSSAKHAVESLLRGAPHSSVYKWLEKKRREMKRREILGM